MHFSVSQVALYKFKIRDNNYIIFLQIYINTFPRACVFISSKEHVVMFN